MNTLERKVENQVQFWSLLGPFLILLSIAILLVKVSNHWIYPLSVLIGIPLCVKWKLKGMAAALSCLCILTIVSFQRLDLDERYWHVGMALAIAFSFIIMTLSLEEVQTLIEKLQIESRSRLDNFLHLDGKLKAAEWEWHLEREKLKVQIDSFVKDLSQVTEEKQTFYKLAQLAKDELIQVRTQHELLLQEFFYKKQQIAQLNERLDESEMTVQQFVNSDSEKQIGQLAESLELAGLEKERLKAQLTLISNERYLLEERLEVLTQQMVTEAQRIQEEHEKLDEESKKEQLILENHYEEKIKLIRVEADGQHQLLLRREEELKCAEAKLFECEQLLINAQSDLEKAKEETFTLKNYKEKLPYSSGNTRSIESMYVQLKEQFEEKALMLDLARKELFHVQEQLLLKQKDSEEDQLFNIPKKEEALEREIVRISYFYEELEKEYIKEIELLNQVVDHLMKS